ncbi:unnamed protein product [Parajaminaea phylloscopi]
MTFSSESSPILGPADRESSPAWSGASVSRRSRSPASETASTPREDFDTESEKEVSDDGQVDNRDERRKQRRSANQKRRRVLDSPSAQGEASVSHTSLDAHPTLRDLYPPSLFTEGFSTTLALAKPYFEAASRTTDAKKRGQDNFLRLRMRLKAQRSGKKGKAENSGEDQEASIEGSSSSIAAPDWVKDEANSWLALIDQQLR